MAGSVSGLHVFGPDTGPESLSLLDTNYSSLTTALNTLANFSNAYHDGGAVNALAVTVNAPQMFTYADGVVLEVLLAATNTSSAVTLNVNGLGAKGVTDSDGSALAVGRLVGGQWARFIYDATAGQFRLIGGGAPGVFSGALTVATGGSSIKGGLTITAPAAGASLTVNALAGATVAQVLTGSAANNIYSQITDGTKDFRLGLISGANPSIATITSDPLDFYTSATKRLSISATGQVTVSTPNAGNTALSVNGVANSNTIEAQGSSTVGQSFGIRIDAGTNSSDYALTAHNISNTPLFTIRGDGLVFVVDDGGTLQIVGYRGVPFNTQAGNYTAVLSDRGKIINMGGTGATLTIPANVFSANDVLSILDTGGGTITIAQGVGLTLFWANGGGNVSGNRSMVFYSIATVVFSSGTQAFITGSGLS